MDDFWFYLVVAVVILLVAAVLVFVGYEIYQDSILHAGTVLSINGDNVLVDCEAYGKLIAKDPFGVNVGDKVYVKRNSGFGIDTYNIVGENNE